MKTLHASTYVVTSADDMDRRDVIDWQDEEGRWGFWQGKIDFGGYVRCFIFISALCAKAVATTRL
jgi:hypothetical protein